MLGLNLGATSSSGGVAGYDFENALSFDGVNDQLTSSSITATGDFTFSFWLKPELATGTQNRFWLVENSSNDRVFFYPTVVYWRATGGTNQNAWNHDYRNGVGAWHHYCISRISGVVKLYVDGVAQTYLSQATNTSAFTIGNLSFNQSGGVYPYKGLADEWAFKIGVGATQANVDAIYNSGNGAAFDSVITSPDQYVKFNEATSYTGTTAVDSSGNGNNFTLQNFTGTPFVPH